jgi:Zn-dependent protease with chaperone function
MSFLKSLLIPSVSLAFFLTAPYWLDRHVHSQFYDAIDQSGDLSPSDKQQRKEDYAQISFREVCSDHSPPQYADLRKDLDDDGVVDDFQRLLWGLDLSVILVGVLVAAMTGIFALNQRAKKSQDALIVNYRLSYRIATAVSLFNVALSIPLLAYGSFEFMCLLADEYSIKLLAAIVLGGVAVLWSSVAILLKKVPLEFQEPMARELAPEEAPELWQVVRAAAGRLQTAPPDRIISGIQMNFYVTELAVKHDHGRVEGRTLFLSYPLLKQLSEDEVLAIIGHELGHFIGQDTRLTREFYPLKFKVHSVMMVLAQVVWVGWPSLELLNFFTWCFEETVQATSRARELLADAKGASLTSPRVMARALIKLQVALEIFQRNLASALRHHAAQAPDPMNIDLKSSIQQNLATDTAFWTQLFEKKLPHPLDTHPSLHIRLEGLGQMVTPDEARAMALEDAGTAHARWLAERETLFTELSTQAEQAIVKMRAQAQITDADYQTPEGKALLDQHFPEIIWSSKPVSFWLMGVLFGCLLTLLVLSLIFLGDVLIIGLVSLPVLLVGTIIYAHWKTHRGTRFILNVEGVHYTGWKHPLRFQDLEKVMTLSVNGALNLVFHFKQRQTSPVRFNPNFFKVKSVTFPLARLQEKPPIVAQTVFRYFIRQTE